MNFVKKRYFFSCIWKVLTVQFCLIFLIYMAVQLEIVKVKLPNIYLNFDRSVVWNSDLPPSTLLFNITNFEYIINNDVCGNDNIFTITIIHSTPHHKIFRDTIRKTWGSPKILCNKIMRKVFLLAMVNNETLQKELEEESRQYRDIVQGNFVDAYRNLTYKNIMGLKWVTEFCPQARFVLKSDQDIFVELFQLYNLLTVDFANMTSNFIACFEWTSMEVVRDKSNFYYVDYEEYPFNRTIFPHYCSGWFYILTPDLAKKLYVESFRHRFMWIDDVHVTGTLVESLNISHLHLNSKYNLSPNQLKDWVNSFNIQPVKMIVTSYYSDFDLCVNGWVKSFRSWLRNLTQICNLEENRSNIILSI